MTRVVADGVSKMYPSGVTAVDSVSLTVSPGEVVGLLGPNGAGKTTLLRMVLGLVSPSAGLVVMVGPDAEGAGIEIAGGLLEQPAFYPYMSGRNNLRVLARYTDIAESRVDELLELLGLADRAHDRVGSYSQGMRQRLGIAAALLKDPDIVVLDEPTNGLDPAGVSEVREIVRNLADSDRAVLISSHLLSEMEQLCDRVVILHEGRVVAEGAPAEMGNAGLISVAVDNPALGLRVLAGLDWIGAVSVSGSRLEVQVPLERTPEVVSKLAARGVGIYEVTNLRQSLESVFLELTSLGGGD